MAKKHKLVGLVLVALAVAACDGDTHVDDGGTDADTDTDLDGGADSGPDPTLDLGEVRILEAGDDGSFTFALEPGGEEEQYVLLLVSGSRQVLGEFEYQVALDGEPLGPPEQTGPVGYQAFGGAQTPLAWEQATAAVLAGGMAPLETKADPPAVGDTVPFAIDSGAGYVDIDCEVMLVSDELVVVFDRTTEPDLEIDPTILDEVSQNFAEVVLPRERVYFGQESDVNADGHVTMLFSPLVFTGSGGATAYVFPCDLLADGTPGCPASNEQELIYMSPPELLSSYMGTAAAITETAAHEFQHAIYFYRKFMLNDAVAQDESAYVTEGMSAMAQDVSGFQAGNLYVAGAAIDGVDDISMASVLDYPMGYNEEFDGVYRGAAYLFLRYLFEQMGGDSMNGAGEIEDHGGIAFLNGMSDLPEYGYDGVEAATGQPAQWLIVQMYTAMLLDDRESQGEPLSDDPAFNYAPIWTDPITGKQHGITMSYDLAGGSWPVRGVPLQQGGADGSIRSGGAEYVLIEGVQAGGILEISATGEGAADLGARLIRIN
jgi:hypothetical protein